MLRRPTATGQIESVLLEEAENRAAMYELPFKSWHMIKDVIIGLWRLDQPFVVQEFLYVDDLLPSLLPSACAECDQP